MRPAHLTKEAIQTGPPKDFYQHLEVTDFNRLLEGLSLMAVDRTTLQRYEVAGWVAEQMPAYEFINYKTALKYVAIALRLPQK